MALDIDNLPADTSELTQRVGVTFDDNGEPDSGFVIVSKDSERYRAESKRQRVAGIRRSAQKKTTIDTKTEAGAGELVRIVDANEVDLACAIVVDWFGFVKNKKPIAFDATIARKLLETRSGWRVAVLNALENEAGFLPSSTTN